MKKLFLFLTAVVLLAGLGSAKAATSNTLIVTALSGTVEVSADGNNWAPAALNQELVTAEKIRTKDGRAELRFSDGTSLNLKENSLLDLLQVKCENSVQDSTIKLWYGKVRSKVTKLQSGGKFEVHTPKVIAAVKGTEFVLGTTNEESELSVIEGIVSLADILREKEIFVKENERSSFRDGLFENPRGMSPDELNNLRNSFETGMLNNNKGMGAPGREFSPEEVKEMNDLRRDLADVKDRSDLENKLDLLDQIADVQLGKSAVDKNGYRVRSENYILRPTAASMMMLNITKREDGPNSGITSLEVTDVFNKPLPDNFMDVKIALGQNNTWTNMNHPPDYYYLSETSILRNPFGDSVTDLLAFSTGPQWDAGHTWYDQNFSEIFSINTSQKWSKDHTYLGQNSYKGADLLPTGSGGADLPYTTATTAILDGKTLIGMKVRETFTDSTFLDKELYLIDDKGSVQDMMAQEGHIYDFNWELVWSAPEFSGRTIDLIVIPQIFNEMTF